jgi:hypothetical protein
VGCRDSLRHGERITSEHGETLVSCGERFELGFFNATGSASLKRYVGIWYKWDQQTIVWVANRDNPVLNGSTGVFFGIADDGKLEVWDNTRKVYWKAGVEYSRSLNRNLKLMDSGNLVLRDEQYAKTLWESFQNPTDTFLPGMKMDEELTLTSWIGDGDPGSGNFTFKQDQEGEGHYVISKKPFDYWRSWMSGNFWISDEMPYGAIAYFLSNFSNSVKQTKNKLLPNSTKQLQLDNDTRLVMNYKGQLQWWDGDKGNWSLIWGEPKDNCSIYNACGNFGSCNINNRLVCKCLPGFQPSYPEQWNYGDFLGGCTKKLTSFDKSDMFLNLKMMKVGKPDSTFKVKNEIECKNEYCLNRSECQAYSYEVVQSSKQRSDTTTGTHNCRIWTSDLINLQEEYPNNGINLSVRVAKSAIGTPFTHWNMYAWINSIAELHP